MTTIDNIMEMVDDYAEEYNSAMVPQTKQAVIDAKEALHTALAEAYKEAFSRGMAVRSASAAQPEKPAWRCTGHGLKRHITQAQYDAQTDKIKNWYEPFFCAGCKSQAVQPVREPLTDEKIGMAWLATSDPVGLVGNSKTQSMYESLPEQLNVPTVS